MAAMGTKFILDLIPNLFDDTKSVAEMRSFDMAFVDSCFAKYDHDRKERLPSNGPVFDCATSENEKVRSRRGGKLPSKYWETQCSWLGMAMQQSLAHRKFVLTRTQDPGPLIALGAKGLPTLVICGKYDAHLNGIILAKELRARSFTRVECRIIEKGGSHAVHIENREEVMACLLKFAARAVNSVRALTKCRSPYVVIRAQPPLTSRAVTISAVKSIVWSTFVAFAWLVDHVHSIFPCLVHWGQSPAYFRRQR